MKFTGLTFFTYSLVFPHFRNDATNRAIVNVCVINDQT